MFFGLAYDAVRIAGGICRLGFMRLNLEPLTACVTVHTISSMKVEFDPAKDVRNIAKHGISLALTAEMDWAFAMIWPDTRYEYGEARLVALILFKERVYFVAFVNRANCRRIISLRKANCREVKIYAENN
ncbi:MAG: BrnT family toxin [Methylophilaceae bacterium]